ncbi:MAG: LysR family transcriptional regulator [Polyangiales bacterium]
MDLPDLNLLVMLDVLLAERSVTAAGRRLRLSPSAMSRALSKLRDTLGDPVLVRAGRGLVATPRALALHAAVAAIVRSAEGVLRPAIALDLSRLVRTFTVRVADGFVESFGPALIERTSAEAPGVRLRFVSKSDKDSARLRSGEIDLETGVVNQETSPELRAVALFDDRFVGVVRKGHPLGEKPVTARRYAAGRHVAFSRRGHAKGRIDEALSALGLERTVVTIVESFAAALALARATDLIASVPEHHTRALREGLRTFALPFAAPELTVSLLWHPRFDADAGHRWLRELVREIVRRPRERGQRREKSEGPTAARGSG